MLFGSFFGGTAADYCRRYWRRTSLQSVSRSVSQSSTCSWNMDHSLRSLSFFRRQGRRRLRHCLIEAGIVPRLFRDSACKHKYKRSWIDESAFWRASGAGWEELECGAGGPGMVACPTTRKQIARAHFGRFLRFDGVAARRGLARIENWSTPYAFAVGGIDCGNECSAKTSFRHKRRPARRVGIGGLSRCARNFGCDRWWFRNNRVGSVLPG